MLKMFKPKCLSGETPCALSATGHLLPCCWVDWPYDPDFSILFADDLTLDKVSGVEHIVASTNWQTFINNIKQGSPPARCIQKCTVDKNL